MKKKFNIIICSLFCLFLINCSADVKLLKSKSLSNKNNVFKDITNNNIKNNQTALNINASLKEHLEGHFIPVYRHSRLHASSFRKGISHYKVYLNRSLMNLDYPRVSH